MHYLSRLIALCIGFLPLRQGIREDEGDQIYSFIDLDHDSSDEGAGPVTKTKPFDVVMDSMKSKVDVDLTFVVSGSGSLMDNEWADSLDFFSSITSRFELAPDGSTAVVIQCSYGAEVFCELGAHWNNENFTKCLKRTKQRVRKTRGDLGLRKALERAEKNCDAKSPRKQLVFFLGYGDLSVSEEQKADAVAAAKEIEALKCKPRLFSMAVGPLANGKEIEQLVNAEEKGEQFFYAVDDFHTLRDLVGPLMLVVEGQLEDAPPIENNDWEMMVAAIGGKVGQFHCGNLCVKEAYYGLFDVTGTQLRAGFFQAKERWELVITLGRLVEYSTNEQVLPLFIQSAVKILQEMLDQGISGKAVSEWVKSLLKMTESEFASELGGMFSAVADAVNVTEALVLVAEYESIKKLGLLKDVDLGGGELDELRTQISGRMVKFTYEAQRFEKHMPLVEPKWFQRFWSAWQRAWGTVRVYVKVTTQCSVVVPPKFLHSERTTFRTNTSYQAYWGTCRSATPYPSSQWPSAVAACARSDENSDWASTSGKVHEHDRMLRYLGCGENGRMRNVEPSVISGPRTLCRSGLTNCDYNSNLCPPGSTSSGKCRLYGPFWGIFSAKVDHIFGLKNGLEVGREDTVEETCHLNLNASTSYAGAKCGPPQVEAFKAMINEGTNSYIYGALPALPVSLAEQYKYGWPASGWGSSSHGVEGPTSWPLPHQRLRDPPLGHVLREVQRGSTIVMLAYGFSGAGKTSTLVGSADNAIDGALSLFLEQYGRFIHDIEMRVVEVYGRLSPVAGNFVPGTGSGLWGFKIKSSGTKMAFIGDWESFHTGGKMDFAKLNRKIDAYRVSLRKHVFRSVQKRQFKWATKILTILAEVEDQRRRQTASEDGLRKAGSQLTDPMAHIRGTPNNPSSSRGTLFCLFDFVFKHGGKGTVALIDLAGSEDPVTMVSSFAEFISPAPPGEAYTSEASAQRTRAATMCPPGEPNDKLIRNNLHRLADYNFLDSELAECLQFRDFLVECTEPRDEMPPSCARVMLHGKERYLKPNLEKEVSFVRKSQRKPGSFRPFTFAYGGIEFGPVPVETVLASLRGGNTTLDSENFQRKQWRNWPKELEKDCSRACDIEIPKNAFRCSPVRLSIDGEVRDVYADLQLEEADRDLLSGKPTGIDWRLNRCLDPAQPASLLEEESIVDDELFEEVTEGVSDEDAAAAMPSPYSAPKKGRGGGRRGGGSQQRVKSCRKLNDPFEGDRPGEEPQVRSRGCIWPARVWLSDPARGRWTIEKQLFLQKKGTTNYPKQELPAIREKFWRALKAYVEEYKQADAKNRYDWDKHVAYFSQVIGPMVEEALYINEMLNQMKSFITAVSFWGQNEELVPWPEGSEGNFGDPLVETQIVNMNDPRYGGYSKDKLVQPAGQAESFYEEISEDGRDQILGMSMFELIRRGSLKTTNSSENYRVLFGSFVRTDRPNGDPDCSGARQSLEFAQYVLEAVGTHRDDAIKALTCRTKP